MKRRLPVRSEAPTDALLSPPGGPCIEKSGCQVHPLGEDPSFQTLTPRSLAKSVAELDALRSRVHELELKLSQNEIEALVAAQESVKKLPPLGLESPLSGVDESSYCDRARDLNSTELLAVPSCWLATEIPDEHREKHNIGSKGSRTQVCRHAATSRIQRRRPQYPDESCSESEAPFRFEILRCSADWSAFTTTVCRPTQTEMVIKYLGKQLAKSTTIVEDTGVLPCDLERATSFRVRKALTNLEKNVATIEMMVGKPVYHYFLKHSVGAKIVGKDEWSDKDKQWRDVDLPYVDIEACTLIYSYHTNFKSSVDGPPKTPLNAKQQNKMLTARDSCVVLATALALLTYQHGVNYYARWKGERARRRNPLIPAQIVTTDDHMDTCDDGVPRRIKKAETGAACCRNIGCCCAIIVLTLDLVALPECMGIQHVWIVEPAFYKKHKAERHISREATDWLTIRRFKTTQACIEELLSNGYEIWATDLSQDAVSLEAPGLELPDRVAIVMGREADGVSKAMLGAADKRVYLPIHGFADSLNLNVATGMVLLRLFYMCPEARGAMLPNERTKLRDTWYRRMVKGTEDADGFLAAPPAPFCDLRRPDDHRGAWMGGKVKRKIIKKERQILQEELAAVAVSSSS
ncbi:Rna methyltransferase, trmh superfamily protein, partial [Globisporangium splendens]